jgi:hypothetical protein
MIKILVESCNPPERKMSYPIIKTNGACLVLFTSYQTGTLIGPNLMWRRMGEYRTDWYEENFTLWDGQITLKNDY